MFARSRPNWARLASLALAMVALAVIGSCRRGVPVVDLASKPSTAHGTISGTVRGPHGTAPVNARPVELVNVDTGERQRTTTNRAGGFTFEVRPGRYRVELTLRAGEALVERPGIIDVNPSDVDAHADFVIGNPRSSRPRWHPANDDLGAPIA